MDTRRLIENRIEQYRSLIRGALDKSSHEALKRQLEADVATLDDLKRVEAERDRHRMLS